MVAKITKILLHSLCGLGGSLPSLDGRSSYQWRILICRSSLFASVNCLCPECRIHSLHALMHFLVQSPLQSSTLEKGWRWPYMYYNFHFKRNRSATACCCAVNIITFALDERIFKYKQVGTKQ